jgi:hypothetical protein
MKDNTNWSMPYYVVSKNAMGFVLGDYDSHTIDVFPNTRKGLKNLIALLEKELMQEVPKKKKK